MDLYESMSETMDRIRSYRDYGQRNTQEEEMDLFIELINEYEPLESIKNNLIAIQQSKYDFEF